MNRENSERVKCVCVWEKEREREEEWKIECVCLCYIRVFEALDALVEKQKSEIQSREVKTKQRLRKLRRDGGGDI